MPLFQNIDNVGLENPLLDNPLVQTKGSMRSVTIAALLNSTTDLRMEIRSLRRILWGGLWHGDTSPFTICQNLTHVNGGSFCGGKNFNVRPSAQGIRGQKRECVEGRSIFGREGTGRGLQPLSETGSAKAPHEVSRTATK